MAVNTYRKSNYLHFPARVRFSNIKNNDEIKH